MAVLRRMLVDKWLVGVLATCLGRVRHRVGRVVVGLSLSQTRRKNA